MSAHMTPTTAGSARAIVAVALLMPLTLSAQVGARGSAPPPPPPTVVLPPLPVGTAPGAAAPATPGRGGPVGPSVGPAIRKIETASAISKEPLGNVTGVRQLSDGRVLVNDGTRRRLLIMDSTMTTLGVVLDSAAEAMNTYGTRAGVLIAFRGDTTLFVDPASYAMLVLDGAGKIVRVRAAPRTSDVTLLASTFSGMPGFDARGRLVYRTYATAAMPAVAPPPGVPWFPEEPDSSFIVSIDLDTRKLDTLGAIRIQAYRTEARLLPTGGYTYYGLTNPLPLYDNWAVLSDGTVTFVRGRDYRVEFRAADGTMTSGPKVPFDWVRLVDEDKQRMMDSIKALRLKSAAVTHTSNMIRWTNLYGKPYPKDFKAPEGYVVPMGYGKDWILPEGVKFPTPYIFACAPGQTPPELANLPPAIAAEYAQMAAMGAPPALLASILASALPVPAAAGTTGRGAAPPGTPAAASPPPAPSCVPAPVASSIVPPMPVQSEVFLTKPSELPDYKPPLAEGATRADEDGNLWVRFTPMRPMPPGGTVYDIINRQGELTDRIQLPVGYALVGFGAGKVVYLTMRDATGLHLARVRLK
jgi:hypothetical protein